MLCTLAKTPKYGLDDNDIVVQCLVVHNAFTVDTGSLEDVSSRRFARLASRFRSGTSAVARSWRQVRVIGSMDCHVHILEYETSRQLFLGDAKSIQEIVSLVRQHILVNANVYDNKLSPLRAGAGIIYHGL
ncbi:hypothetical protein F5141DRAFT_512721 [Pisolithus sp. B1]|nr:hypothetical protein F5141DRAFT_512721 [Pisolithus sp. B1]